MYSEDMKIVWFDGHPCARNTTPGTSRRFACVRCGTDTDFYTASCLPGLTIHVEPARYQGSYWETRYGHRTTSPREGHPLYKPCDVCWSPEVDSVLQPTDHDPIINVGPSAQPGDYVLCKQIPRRVLWVKDYPPGDHEGSIISDTFWARQVVTTHGWRWFGHAPGSRYRGVEISSAHPDGVSFEPEPVS